MIIPTGTPDWPQAPPIDHRNDASPPTHPTRPTRNPPPLRHTHTSTRLYLLHPASPPPKLGLADTGRVLIRIEGTDLPGRLCGPSPERPGGHQGIHVGVQRRNKPGELLGVTVG